MTASNCYRTLTKTQCLQNNISNNAESLLKNLREIDKCESKATKHGTGMELQAKLQDISILKKSHKKFYIYKSRTESWSDIFKFINIFI